MTKVAIILSLFLGACSQYEKAQKIEADKLVTEMHAVNNSKIKGSITIEDLRNEYKITTNISGLTPDSKFGFHIHQNGICEGPDYKSAGDHYNPHQKTHGGPHSSERHSGDLGNLLTNSTGESKQVILITKSENDKFLELVNKTILIHEKEDDFKTQPSGDSGKRVACGIIKPI